MTRILRLESMHARLTVQTGRCGIEIGPLNRILHRARETWRLTLLGRIEILSKKTVVDRADFANLHVIGQSGQIGARRSMEIRIDPASAVPVYAQVVEQVRTLIALRALRPGRQAAVGP